MTEIFDVKLERQMFVEKGLPAAVFSFHLKNQKFDFVLPTNQRRRRSQTLSFVADQRLHLICKVSKLFSNFFFTTF
jgi:hypothetical protein